MRSRYFVDRRLSSWMVWAAIAGTMFLSCAAPRAVADDAVAKWTQALKSGDEKTRLDAIDALGQMGPAAKGATGALAALLSDKSAEVRANAAFALQNIGPDAMAAAPALAKAILDPDLHVQHMAIAALEKIRPDPKMVVEVLGKALEDDDPAVQVAALQALTEYSDAALPVLKKSLANPETTYWAALAIGELGPKAKGAVDNLVGALTHKDPQTRREVLIAISRVGADAASAVPSITPLLEDPDTTVRNAAALALGSMGPAAAAATDALRKGIHSKDELEQCVSCWALARIEPENKEARETAIKHLLEVVKNNNPRVQSAALRGLMDLQAEPKQIVPALAYVIINGQEPAVGEALGALSTLGETAAPVLADAVANRPEARARAATLIAYLGPKAKAAVPALSAALSDQDPEVRRELLFALAAIGPDSAPAFAALQKALDDSEPRNRAIAAYALGRIGPPAKAALPKLQVELSSADPLIRVASAYALVHVLPGNEAIAKAALPVLVQGLQNPVAAARRGAAEALAQIGKPARTAAEGALRAATHDPDESVRKAALEALERMGAVVDGVRPSVSLKR